MSPPPDLQSAADALIAQASAQATGASEAGARMADQIGQLSHSIDTATWFGVVPLALTLLILHELYESTSTHRAFRPGYVCLRAGGLIALLLAYGKVVGLITGVAGAWGQWASWDDIVGPVTRGASDHLEQFSHGLALEMIPGLLLWLMLFAIVMVCAVFAFAATLLLSISQGFLLAIIIALGKAALAVSIVPGVGVGKSWARFLAMVAAWSTVGGTVASVILSHAYAQTAYGAVAGSGDNWMPATGYMLQTAAIYFVLAVFTIAVPFITSALFSGAGSVAPGVGLALYAAVRGARTASRTAMSVGRGGVRAAAGGVRRLAGRDRFDGDPNAGGHRVHKAPRARTAVAARGTIAPNRAPNARASKPPAPRPAPAPAADIPAGRPGAEHWRATASDTARADYRAQSTAPIADVSPPPPPSPTLSARARQHRATLRAAYPSLRFSPNKLTPRERALLSELDAPHGRFASWHRGAQGRGDFSEALERADRRVQAATLGQAGAHPASAAPTHAPRPLGGAPAATVVQPIAPRASAPHPSATARATSAASPEPATPIAPARRASHAPAVQARSQPSASDTPRVVHPRVIQRPASNSAPAPQHPRRAPRRATPDDPTAPDRIHKS